MEGNTSFDRLSKELTKLIGQSNKSLEAYLPSLQETVNSIITQHSTDIKAIEHLLDSLSSLLYGGIGHQLYLKLLEYYKTIDKEGADFYWNLYEEIME